jgi:hypothetical protein
VDRVAIAWAIREPPLPAAAVLGVGPVAAALGRVLRDRPELAALARVVVGRELLCMLAPSESLPWVDGVWILGEAAPGLYCPTTLRPAIGQEGEDLVPLESGLLVQACRAHGHATPLALVPALALAVPLALARPVDLAELDRWLTSEDSP